MVSILTFTPQEAQQRLQDGGLATLGLAGVVLAKRWSTTGVDVDDDTCTLTITNPSAPFRALLDWTDSPAEFSDPSGASLTGPAAVLRLHPQAVLRLEALATARYVPAGQPATTSVPWAMVLRNAGAAPNVEPQWYEAGEPLGNPAIASATVSFHDGRGLVIDPVAVAAILDDLIATFPALVVPAANGSVSDPGGIRSIAGLRSGVRVHVVDPHGAAFAPADPAVTVQRMQGATVMGAVPTTGLIDLGPGEALAATSGGAGRIVFGWAGNGTMVDTLDATPATLSPPALPTTAVPAGSTVPNLGRRFLRAIAVDTAWFLLGNRTTGDVLGVHGDDGAIPASLQPRVRQRVTIQYLGDGVDVLAAGGAVMNRLFAGGAGLGFIASPTLDTAVGVPPASGAPGHWPQFPAPNTNAAFPATMPDFTTANCSAVWSGTADVVVTLPGGALPDGAHVRLYPQHFQTIAAIGPDPSFVRGDGGAAIVSGANPVLVTCANPFALVPGQSRPSPSTLVVDIVVTTRTGQRHSWGAVSLLVGSAAPPAVPDPFAVPDAIAAVPTTQEAVAPSPLFGLPRPPAPPGPAPSSPIDIVRALGSETSPRQGPRVPTMGRHETVAVTGLDVAGQSTLAWEAVVTGGRWARETRSADPRDGNPGNPAGPDALTAGVHVDGQLAYDFARHAAKRAQPIFPLPGSAYPPGFGWLATMGGDNFNPPPVPPTAASTGVGAMLETVAAVCETPEFSLPAIDLSPDTVTLHDVLNAIGTALGLGGPPSITVANGDRLVDEVRREFFVSRHGTRDALWALRRAVAQARELIYIESPQFSRTAYPGGSAAVVDLVAELMARVTAQKSLRVLIAVPRVPDFAPAWGGYVRQAIAARAEAVGALKGAAPDRVVVFHPIGYPGRPALLRSTTMIVDDVWAMVGASHWRRRGMTFDGSAAVVSFDRVFEEGYSKAVRQLRRLRMAQLLDVTPPAAGSDADGEWIQLARPAPAVNLVAELLRQGGLGRIQPLWSGPTDTSVLPATADMADPDGTDGAHFVTAFGALLGETP